MTGRFVDNLIYAFKTEKHFEYFNYLDTDFGKIRMFDSGEKKPVIINVPDAPNTIEHQLNLLALLSKNHRVICFEYPGCGFSYPTSKFDYSFEHGTNLILQIMDILKIKNASLMFSCSNGYYALNAAMISSQKFKHIFISQTPSIHAIVKWTEKSIPNLLKVPIIGQLSNKILAKKLSNVWYDIALPKISDFKNDFKNKSQLSINQGGCFCLSSLVQGLDKEKNRNLTLERTKVTLVWGGKDYSHRNTSKESILDHVANCEIIEFPKCGHFPDLENSNEFAKLVNERLN